jgi:hypothetical protein
LESLHLLAATVTHGEASPEKANDEKSSSADTSTDPSFGACA